MTSDKMFSSVRLKYVAHVEMGQSPPSGDYFPNENGDLPFLQGTADFGPTHPEPQVYCPTPTKIANSGDILFSVRAPVGEMNWANRSYGIGRGLCAIRPKAATYRTYAWWAIQAVRQELNAVATGSTYEAVATEDVANLSIPYPSAHEQKAIAEFLNRETSHIDATIAAKEHQLSLLAEKRRSLVTQAVTRGLDPNVTLKDSGMPWLGKIPAHWGTERLRWLSSGIEQGWSPQADEREPQLDEWGVIKLSAVNTGIFDDTKTKALPLDADVPQNLEIQQGDFLITRANTPGLVADVCYVQKTRTNLILSDLVYRLRVIVEYLNPEFLSYFLLSPIGRMQIEKDARGTSASMVKINQEHIRDWLLPVPPIAEQNQIANYLEAETRKIDDIQQTTERTIALLKERRASLIAAAVTGQLPVGMK